MKLKLWKLSDKLNILKQQCVQPVGISKNFYKGALGAMS